MLTAGVLKRQTGQGHFGRLNTTRHVAAGVVQRREERVYDAWIELRSRSLP